jgi:hypothetical protein
VPQPPELRYYTQYVFAVPDKNNGKIVEFTVPGVGCSEKVQDFEGDRKLLREIVVPSLTSD